MSSIPPPPGDLRDFSHENCEWGGYSSKVPSGLFSIDRKGRVRLKYCTVSLGAK